MLPIDVRPLCKARFGPPAGYDFVLTRLINSRRSDGEIRRLRQAYESCLKLHLRLASERIVSTYIEFYMDILPQPAYGYSGLLLRGWRSRN